MGVVSLSATATATATAIAAIQLFQYQQQSPPPPLVRGGVFPITRGGSGGGGAFSISTRTQICFPQRRRRLLFFLVKSVESSSIVDDGLQSFGVVPSNVLTTEKEEVKAVLTMFLKKEIGLSNEAEQEQEQEQEQHISEASPTKLPLDSKKLKAMARMTEIGTDGKLPPNTLYLIDIGLDMNQIKRIACKYPSSTYPGWGRNIRPLVEFLLDLGVPPSDIPNILYKSPSLCNFSLSENIIPSMAYLETLGLDKSKWAKVIKRFPNLLTFSKQKVTLVVDYLYELGLSRDRIGKVLTTSPGIVGLSIDDNLRPTAEYFRSMGVNLTSLFGHHPGVFYRSIERQLKPVTEFLLDKGFSIEEIGIMASRFGSIYRYSLTTNLIPKWDFFLTMDYPRSVLVKFPTYFGLSLEKRIKPRYALMRECDVKLSLSYLLYQSDSEFEKFMNRSMKNRLVAQHDSIHVTSDDDRK